MQTMHTAVDDFEQALEPLVHAQNLAEWDAATEATDANEEQLVAASKRVDAVLAERERYEQLVEADQGGGDDAQFSRRVRLARLASEASQRERALADRIIESEARLGSLFSRHRGTIGGRDVNDNEIAKILRESSNREERRQAWDASKSIGPQAAPLVRELAHLRNEAARALGYRDHFVFSLTLDELDEVWLLALLDDLEGRLSRPGRARRRPSTRASASAWASPPARRCSRGTTPTRSSRICRRPVTIRSRRRSRASTRSRSRGITSARSATTSTACWRAATSTRATARTSTRSAPTSTAGHDVRVLANCEPGTRWLGTMVHELGHAVYDLAIDAELPWLLRSPAHTFTTEAIAMLHGRLVRDETFLERFARRRAESPAIPARARCSAARC